MSRESIDQDLLDRYLAGECGPAEVAGIETYLAAHPGVAAAITRARSELDPGASLPRNTLASLHALHARIAQADRAATHGPLSVGSRAQGSGIAYPWPRGVRGGGRWLSLPAVAARGARPQPLIAAMVVVALGVGLAVGSSRRRASIASPGHEYVAMAGQRLGVTLVDGTQLTLAPASTVRIAEDYGRGSGSREVALEGEAYFTVVHDAGHPFAVRTRGAVARDVGTSFDIRFYPGDADARVAVAEGAVAVATTSGCRMVAGRPAAAGAGFGTGAACDAQVLAGDVATVTGEGVAVQHGVDVASVASWTRGELRFRNAPLRAVAAELSRWYDLDVRVPDAVLGAKQVTGTFAGKSLAEGLSFLGATLEARVERHGREVTFVPQPR